MEEKISEVMCSFEIEDVIDAAMDGYMFGKATGIAVLEYSTMKLATVSVPAGSNLVVNGFTPILDIPFDLPEELAALWATNRDYSEFFRLCKEAE